jgi:3-isopropylmalate dehydratase small subunit
VPVLSEEQGIKTYSADAIKKICFDAGVDDVGLVEMDRESVQKEPKNIKASVVANREYGKVA